MKHRHRLRRAESTITNRGCLDCQKAVRITYENNWDDDESEPRPHPPANCESCGRELPHVRIVYVDDWSAWTT